MKKTELYLKLDGILVGFEVVHAFEEEDSEFNVRGGHYVKEITDVWINVCDESIKFNDNEIIVKLDVSDFDLDKLQERFCEMLNQLN
jgi:hypothetical protein